MQSLPGLSAHAGHRWDPELLLSFGEAVLMWVKDAASKQPGQQMRVRYDPSSSSISCEAAADGDMPDRLAQLIVD